jgi:hypothetical protein
MYGFIRARLGLKTRIKMSVCTVVTLIVAVTLAVTGCTSTIKESLSSSSELEDYIVSETETLNNYAIQEYYITEYCNMYKDTLNINRNNKICSIDKGEKVEVFVPYDKCTKYLKVRYNSEIGYIQSDYLISTEDAYIDSDNNIITVVNYDGTIIKDSDTIGNNLVNYAYNYWYKVPDAIRNDFIQNDWKIELTNEELSKVYDLDYSIIGITLPEDKKIRIIATQSNIRKALIHEVGHYLDYSLDYVSLNEDWNKAINNEIDYIRADVATLNNKEYFAEAFRIYLSNDSGTKVLIPNTMKLIKNAIQLRKE